MINNLQRVFSIPLSDNNKNQRFPLFIFSHKSIYNAIVMFSTNKLTMNVLENLENEKMINKQMSVSAFLAFYLTQFWRNSVSMQLLWTRWTGCRKYSSSLIYVTKNIVYWYDYFQHLIITLRMFWRSNWSLNPVTLIESNYKWVMSIE